MKDLSLQKHFSRYLSALKCLRVQFIYETTTQSIYRKHEARGGKAAMYVNHVITSVLNDWLKWVSKKLADEDK